MSRLGFLLFLIVLGSSSCRKKFRPVVSSTEGDKKEIRPPALRSEFLQWPGSFWTAKAKVFVQLGGATVPVNITLRAEEGVSIWFSANAMGLMEVARGRIDADSARVLDKMNNRCYVGGMEVIGDFLPVNLGLRQLQHFMMGKVFWDSLASASQRNAGDTLILEGTQGDVFFNARLREKFNLQQASATLAPSNSWVQLKNDQFRPVSGFPIAFRKEIQTRYVSEGKTNENKIRIEFSRFEFVTERPDMAFELPADCERKVIR